MKTFLFGAAIGAIAMYLHLEGFGPLIGIAQGWWDGVSAPQRSALQQ